jgi:hypothetical protein
MELTHKLVAIINKDLPSGVALNALAHMTVGLGASLGSTALQLDNYQDKEANAYPNISKMPFIILRGKSGEIRKAVKAAREMNFPYGVFLNTMTGGTYQEQLNNTANTNEEQLIYYGAVLYGPIESVNTVTKKFSLWRDVVATAEPTV